MAAQVNDSILGGYFFAALLLWWLVAMAVVDVARRPRRLAASCGFLPRKGMPKCSSAAGRVRMSTMCYRLVAIMLIILLSGCERYWLDRQMQELCAKDGGVKVYKTVTLSPAEYEALFKYKVRAKSREEYYGPEYRYIATRTVIAGKQDRAPGSGRGQLARNHYAIYLRSVNLLLGENVEYSRVGGDLITFGFQPSGNHCPKRRVSLAQSVFVKGE